MLLTASKSLYKGIALLSCVVLIGLLIQLTYNTFRLNDQQYQSTEKMLIKEYYRTSIRNDKLFPGGAKIIDDHLSPNICLLDSLHLNKSPELSLKIDSLLTRLIEDLRQYNTMDTVFNKINERYQLGEKWEYALVLKNLTVIGSEMQRVPLYKVNHEKLAESNGIRIGGKLKGIKSTNLTSEFTVNSPSSYSYEITFALYADRVDREWVLFKLVAPIFLFGLACIGSIIVVYFLTYKNWIRQKELAEMKSDFVNSITHEFHTPLSTIMVANKNLQNNPEIRDNPTVSSISSVIERQTMRLQRLFSQVLDITSMVGSQVLKEDVNITQMLSTVIEDYKWNIQDEKIRLTFENYGADVHVELNPFFFTTMIINLLENAVKHNSKEVKAISVELVDKGGGLEIIITDNGDGIENREIVHVFNKFQRSSQSKNDGLGLGLYYVKQCVSSHGWNLYVTSEKNVGTQFILFIPKMNKS